jgi:uncharacterized protein YbjT (DUF2867 family)
MHKNEYHIAMNSIIMHAANKQRTVLLAGATGLVGREILAALLLDATVAQIHCIGRRAPPIQHPKLTVHLVDFQNLPSLPVVQDVYIALGTTIKTAGSRAAFQAIDLDAIVAVARTCKVQGAARLGVVSAMGADPQSRIFYSRIKGQMEQALTKLNYESTVFVRPSLLTGARAQLGQAPRWGEQIGLKLAPLIHPLIPAHYRAVAARDVAYALIQAVEEGKPGVRCILSGDLQGAADRYV